MATPTAPSTPTKPSSSSLIQALKVPKIPAWGAVAIGILFWASAITSDGLRLGIAVALMGAAIALPGGWWMWCEHKDHLAAARAEKIAESYRFLTDADRVLLGEPPARERVNRRWPVVGIGSVLLVALSVIVTPEEPTPASQSGEAAVTTTATPTSRLSPQEAALSTVVETSIITHTVPTPVPGFAADYKEQTRDLAPAEEAVFPEAARAEPAVASPATAFYSSCSEARSAGAAPLFRGDPGYRSGLDRDHDGVACE